MELLKSLIKKYLSHFSYFYQYLRYRIFIALILSLIVGLLDGFGLAMFLPLLKMVSGEAEPSGEELGGLSFLIDAYDKIGVPLNLSSVLITIVLFFSLKGIGQFARMYYNILVRLYFIKKIRYLNVNNLASYKYKHFVKSDAGMIQNTMTGEVGRVSQAYVAYFNTIQAWVMVLVYVSLAFVTNPQFALLVAVGGGLSNLVYRQIYKRTKQTSLKITKGGHIFQGLLIQMVGFFKYLKATGLMKRYGKKLKDAVDYIERANRKIGFYNSLLYASREPLIIIVVAVVILVQVNLLSANLSGVILSLLFFYRSLTYVLSLQTYWNNFLNVSGSLINMNEFIAEFGKGRESFGATKFKGFGESIDLEGVDMSYDKQKVLQDISLRIQKNQTVAFVGESGSGKTTLVNIISGLLPVDDGKISIDGLDYSELDIRSFQSKIGYITQDPVIFSDSVFNNVTLWADKTEENVSRFWKVLEQAAVKEFVEELELAEDSQLGNNGIQMSGGQKQRVSIARELYKQTEILVMDEATSALDTETEKVIQENIEALHGNNTILIVAHRLSTIKNADVVVLLSKGKILDFGTYNELLQKSDVFRRMAELQVI